MIGWWILWGALFAWLIVWQTRRALREPLEHDRIIAEADDKPAADGEWVYDGPDSLRLIQDLDAHLNAYVLDNPQMAAGFGRLRDAIRDHREEDTP